MFTTNTKISQCLLNQIYPKRIELDIGDFRRNHLCHFLDQSENIVFLAVASLLRVEISVAITLISAVKEEEQ